MRLAPFVPALLAAGAVLVGCAPRPIPAPAPAVYPGFDTAFYPGTEVLAHWREVAPYRWIGFYLAAPCRRDSSWVGRRAEIARQGWGIAALYVGQQTWDGVPDPEVPPPRILCSRTLLTAEQGTREGRDAAAQMAAEGFPPGSVVYLNVERMEAPLPAPMAVYARAWFDAVLADGRYVPGVYAHLRNAELLFGVARQAFLAAGRTDLPPLWVAGGRGFALDRAPDGVGLPYAKIWQGALDVRRTWGEHTLLIDENVARRPDPSAPLPIPAAD